MGTLLDAMDLHRGGDQRWTAGLEVEELQCALSSEMAALCLPPSSALLAGKGGFGQPEGYATSVFAIITRMQESVICRTVDPQQVMRDAVEAEAEKAFGKALWFGTGQSDLWLGNGSVTTVAANSTLDVLLQTWYTKSVGIKPLLHLGLKSALDLSAAMKEGHLNAIPDVNIVVNPMYPVAGMAVTGPIEGWMGDAEVTQVHSTQRNRRYTEATALATLAFDPCSVVIRDVPPDQVYVSTPDVNRTITVFVKGSSTAATVVWGDATGNGTVPPDSNTTHTYANPGSYTVAVTSESGTVNTTVTVI